MARKPAEPAEAVGTDIEPVDLSDTETAIYAGDEEDRAMARAAAYVLKRAYGPNTVALVQYIASRALDSADLNVVILEQMSARLLAAKTPADILTPFDPSHGVELYGKNIEILGAEFLESDLGDGFPWYVSLQARRTGTGPTEAFTIGGEKLVLQVAALDQGDHFPVVVKVHRAEEPTKSGYYPLELRPAA